MRKYFVLSIMLGVFIVADTSGQNTVEGPHRALHQNAAAEAGYRLDSEDDLAPKADASGAANFSTMQDTVLLQESFCGAFPPPGWVVYKLGDANQAWVQNSQGYDDTCSAWHNDNNVASGCDDWLVTPPIDIPANKICELRFMQKVKLYPLYYEYHGVWISTGSGDPNDGQFIELQEVLPQDSDVWEAVEDIPQMLYGGQTIYLAFRYMGDWATEWFVDDVEVSGSEYVNQPPSISHDLKGDTEDTTPTITAFIDDFEGFSAGVFYEAAPKAWTEASMSPTGVLPNEYYVDLPTQPSGTINYYIRAEDDSGLVSTDPPGAPGDFHSFEIQPLVGMEFAYDDSTAESYTAWIAGYEDNRFAVRFSPWAYPCTLTAVRVGIAGDWPDDDHQPFVVEVYDDNGGGGAPGTLLYGPDTTGSIGNVVGGVTGPDWALAYIKAPLVFTSGDFYVAKGQATIYPACEGLGYDQDGAQYSRSWSYGAAGGMWAQYYPGERNLMIRAYVSQAVYYGAIGGTVSEAKGPIQGAVVTAEGSFATGSDTTDASGHYLIEDLPVGLYDVTASAIGYYTETQENRTVLANDTITVDFALNAFGGGQILVVDADGSDYIAAYTDVRSYFTDALVACGYTYDWVEKHSAGADGPSDSLMQNYDAVVWFTGEAWKNEETLTANDEAHLALYLDGGGRLFLSAQDYLYDRYDSYGAFSPGQFPYDYLGVSSTTQDVIWLTQPSTGTATGYDGSVAESLSYSIWDPYSATLSGEKRPDGLVIDELVVHGYPVLEATRGLDHVDIGACQHKGAGFKSVFTTISFAGLVDGASTRAELMASIMDWLLAPMEMWLSDGGVEPVIGQPGDTYTYSVTYTQLNDAAPEVSNVYIDSIAHPMTDPTGGLGPYSGGVVFTYDHQFSMGGNHEFYFDFSDSIDAHRLPAWGSFWGPMNGFYSWDFEGAAHFSTTGPADDWQWGIPTTGPVSAHSGVRCWGTNLTGNYSFNSQSRLETPSLNLTLGGDSKLELKFWHWYDTDSMFTPYDGGNVKLLTPTDTVVIYPDLSQAQDYDTYNMRSSNAWIPGQPGYWGDDRMWKEAVFDLTPWTNESDVVIAFDFGSNSSRQDPGWFIDDVVIWGDPPLPVELANFTAIAGDGMVTLAWETQSERNNLGFDIYRRVEGQEYDRINAERIPGAGTSAAAHFYTYEDTGLTNGVTYYYTIADVDFYGNVWMHYIVVSATPVSMLPRTFELSQNYPNPFNPNTEINYRIPRDSQVILRIYNVMGQEVRTLVDGQKRAGEYVVKWDGRDASGHEVGSGLYFCQLKAGAFGKTIKMVLLR